MAARLSKADREEIERLVAQRPGNEGKVVSMRAEARGTAGDLHSWIVGMCSDQKVSVPHSSWSRVRLELARVVGKSPKLIHPNTLIVRELGFS